MAEISDLIITAKVTITETTNQSYITFNIIEFIKKPQNTTMSTLKLYTSSRAHTTFEQGKEYLVFLIKDVRYHVAYGDYGKLELSTLDPDILDTLRFVFDSSNEIQFQGLIISPRKISQWENITIMFIITNKQAQNDTIGFIIEHHPPAYLIIDEGNTSLKYFQYAKSVSIEAGERFFYKYVLSSKYTGVNTVVMNYLGHQVWAESFTVYEPEVDEVKSYEGIEFQQFLILILGVVLVSIFIVWLLYPD